VALLDRIASATRPGAVEEKRFSVDQWISEYLLPANVFGYGGQQYPFGLNQTYAGQRAQEISASLPGHSAALRRCPPAFAAEMVRALVLSQARFTFRNLASSGSPRRTFGNRDLGVLERPWTNATTGELLTRMEWHAGLAGNAYVYRQPNRLRVLRPDWCAIVYGSQQEPEDAAHALDGEIVGYVYQNGGIRAGNNNRPQTLMPDEVAHWSPIPDPENAGIGMSWITPAVREIQGDQLATDHKVRFFENGATPNLVVSGIPAATKEQFDELVEAMEGRHAGVRNAYRTLYLTAGADATVVGSDLKQLDFKNTQGTGETRIAFLSRVPAPLLGISEGLAGSSLNAGNFGQARRSFADTWVYPTLQDLAAALSSIVNVPTDAELWFDTADMPLLREDAKDAAEIEQIQASTIVSLVNGGFEPKSAIAAVIGQDMNLLKHTGLVSVQLQPPGAVAKPIPAPSPAQAALPPARDAQRADEDLRVAGVDTHPGGEQLKHYWLYGEGAAKWSTWTELYHHLVKYLSPDMAKRTAAEWFHERYGIWPGSDANKVAHGKPPRGHKIGPG
jgi:phage portal protein BeeE